MNAHHFPRPYSGDGPYELTGALTTRGILAGGFPRDARVERKLRERGACRASRWAVMVERFNNLRTVRSQTT
jgi:hypothetical protein